MESAETFEAYAEIDMCYYGLKMIHDESFVSKTPIEQMVDKATGFSQAKTKENIKIGIALLKRIIKAKKTIEADFSGDENMLNALKKLK